MTAIDFGHFERRIAELGASNGQLLGFVLRNADMQLTTDQLFSQVTPFTKYRVSSVVAVRISGAFNTACAGGIYSAASKGGLAWVAAAQSWAGLTGADKIVVPTIDAVASANLARTAPRLSLTTGNAAALVADLFMFVQVLD